jgi:PEP-CTERM motif-containing protein
VAQLSSTVARRAGFVIVILGVAAAATAMWNRYAPPDACLFCAAPEHYETALNTTPDAVATTGASDMRRTGQYAAADSSAVPGASAAPSSHGGSSAALHGDARRSWQPWETGSGAHGFPSSGGMSAPSVGMGGLWRLMSLAHRAPDPLPAAPSPKPAPLPRAAAAPRPSPTPAPAHTAPAPNPPSATSPPTPAPDPIPPSAVPPIPSPEPTPPLPPSGVAPPTSPFNDHTTPPADPFVPPPPSGSLDPGGPGGTGTSGSGPAATPEPASLLLIGTGLVALLTELRRRRVI